MMLLIVSVAANTHLMADIISTTGELIGVMVAQVIMVIGVTSASITQKMTAIIAVEICKMAFV
jgi:hypothetical protein